MAKKSGFADEIEALSAVLDALNDLDEEKRAFVYQTAGERLGLAAPTQRKDKSSGSGTDIDDDDIGSQDDITPKKFMKGKKAKTDVEIIACLAFYLSHYRDAATFKTKDITDLNNTISIAGIFGTNFTHKFIIANIEVEYNMNRTP